MKKFLLIVTTCCVVLFLSAFTYQSIINWKIKTSDAQVKFSLDAHGMETIGSFTGVKGEIKFDPTDLDASSFDVNIKSSSINTGNKGRDKHLTTNDYFGADTYPLISFKSTKLIEEINSWVANGKLTIRDVTKDVTIPFTFESKDGKGIFKGSLDLDRTEYGVGKPSSEVGSHIKISFEIPVER